MRSIRRLLFLVLSALALDPARARADKLVIDWQACLGGTGEEGAAGGASRIVEPTADGGFIAGISSTSDDGDVTAHRGKLDFWIVKLDAAGAVEWQRSLGGSEDDILYSVRQTQDGGYLAVGTTASVDGDLSGTVCEGDPAAAVRSVAERDDDGWVVKLDGEGQVQWQRVFGNNSANLSPDYLQAVWPNADGTCFVAGRTNSDFSGYVPPAPAPAGGADVWVLELDAEGHLLRQKVWGGQGDDGPSAVHRTRAGGLLLAGFTSSDFAAGPPFPNKGFSAEQFDFLVVGLGADLDVRWWKALVGNAQDEATSVIESSRGEVVVAGFTYSTEGALQSDPRHRGLDNGDAVVVTIDPVTHAESWRALLGGTEGERAQSVVEDEDGDYVVAARANSKDKDVTPLACHLGEEGWIAKLRHRNGHLLWERLLGDVNSDSAWSVSPVVGDGYVVAGFTRSNHDQHPCQLGDVSGLHGTMDDLWVVRLKQEKGSRGRGPR